jgi:hypothetical protein
MHERDGAAATTVADDERPAAPTPGEAAAGRGDGAPLTPAQRRGLLAVLAVAAVVQWVIDHPGRELLQIGRRAHIMFRDDHDAIVATEGLGSGPIFSDTTRELWSGTGDWYFRVVLVASVAGLPLLVARSPRPQRRLLLSIVVPLLVIPLLLWGNPRFHLPLVPFMVLAAAALVTGAVARAHRAAGRRD